MDWGNFHLIKTFWLIVFQLIVQPLFFFPQVLTLFWELEFWFVVGPKFHCEKPLIKLLDTMFLITCFSDIHFILVVVEIKYSYSTRRGILDTCLFYPLDIALIFFSLWFCSISLEVITLSYLYTEPCYLVSDIKWTRQWTWGSVKPHFDFFIFSLSNVS